ncbi:interferon-induced very large GTPase 1-like [Apodemus sylvaticus]|uniref:interferon-induced very large GTPase 1-like n=1 Tax=Apodemus sylvaticus TaxID=10129 RepID=UPI00224268DC|nr:interferon-induced very large GTPase 1-like [Apodemus sylvaticus]
MNTAEKFHDKPQLRSRRRHDIQEMLTEVGLSVDYWMPKLQEDLGVTSVQALQYLDNRDLQKLKSQTQHIWEKKALEKLLELSQTNGVAEQQETPGEMIKNRQRQAGQALQALRALQSEGKHREEEAVRREEADLRRAMGIPEECWPVPEVPLKVITETMERHLSHMEQTLSHRANLSDGDLIRWASGGLALQGVYKTSHQKDLVARREELLRVPKEFFLFGPEQGKRMEAKEFTSSQEESMFTEAMEKLGFGAMVSTKDGFSSEFGIKQSKHSEWKDTHQSYSEHSYFCSAKYSYVPLASFHFRTDQLQLSTAALKELKIIEEQLEHTERPDRILTLRNRTENFFNRFGSHANQGPLHLGGIYCWKAISESFKSDQLNHVKQQATETLDSYIRGSYNGFGVEVGARMNTSDSYSVRSCQNATDQQFQSNVQVSVAQTGGPAEANGIVQWTVGLLTSNKTWSVIDKVLHLVPIWDIILNSHRSDFKDPFQVAKCLKDNYTALTGLCAQIQDEEYVYSTGQKTRLFQKNMKSQGVSDYEGKLKTLINSLKTLHEKIKNYAIWIFMFFTDWQLQNFLLSVVNVLKKPATYITQFINVQVCRLNDGGYKAPTASLQMKKQLQWLYPNKNQNYNQQNHENNTKEMIEVGPFLDLLQHLGLAHFYPKRMSRADFHLIYKTAVHKTQPRSEQELPHYFLQKLLMLDCRLRKLTFKDEENHVSNSSFCQKNEAFDPYKESFEDSDGIMESLAKKSQPHIHPMDIQMAILHCADDLTRQYILSKLSICQFALPLVVPNPNTSQMEFFLWSLRQIRKSWQESSKSPQDKSYSHKDQQMCCVSTPIVSFIRVGNGLSASKSQIMNSLLSKRKHDVFFHRHCRGSNKHCLLMEGVLEICWFCPGGQGEDIFDKCLTFTNLHGDAKEHSQQLSFLQDVSSLIVVLMSASDNTEENQKLVRHLCQSSTPLICLIDDKGKAIANNSGKRMRIGIKNRNEAELTEELTNAIKHFLELSSTALSLEDCSQKAREQGFLIDEDQRDCKEAKEKAEIIMALLADWKLSKIKKNLLPLQGKLWHIWCKKDKELYHLKEKGNRSIEQHKSEIHAQKQKIRYQQLEKVFHLNDVMRSFLDILQEYEEASFKYYFLHWLSWFLHNLTIGHLVKLQQEQRSLWSMVQTEKHKKCNSNSLQVWQNQIEAISTEIVACTFGIEHLLREVGQIYEALEETSSSRDSLFLSLPEIAADLMIAGVPIELMDGDASYVPLKWVAAIFDKISEKVGDRRLFVLSVLGLQSSGKSTLLNALFGLQFTVSAGRCTKGAYMQLLKVEETFTEELGVDFVLVVDTEGLRAPELNNKSQKWDNELATFVIGLGNLTLINIFGENPSEIQEILQIAVQAFLRMKQVKISPSCFFVHQNVGEITAKDQTMEGRRRLEQKLDDMTALAAELEECSNITRFSDVIKFDANSHVYYFAHLWEGNPPMAPPNPQYSYNVQELRSRILSTAQQESRGRILKISDVKFRVQDLWKALVSENFIFSFRNTQEVIAMSKLETMYNHWTWELRSHVLDLHNQLSNQIQNGKILILTPNLLEDPISKKYKTIKQEFDRYFEEDPDSELQVQWKANFEQKLLILKDALISETTRKCNEHINLKNSQEILDNQKSKYENQLLERSQKLALSVKGKELSDEQLHEKFSQLWKDWIYNVSLNAPYVTEPNIDLDAENILLEHFKKQKNIVERLKIKSGEIFEINYATHIQMKKKFCMISRSLETYHKESINNTTNNINLKCNETIENIWKQSRDYSQNYFHEILNIIEKEVNSLPCAIDYTFTRDYSIDLALWLFQRASKSFKEMHEAFKSVNDPVNYLERKKDYFFMSFKISCQGATSITSFVDFLWLKLTPAISASIWKMMGPKIAGDMRATCPEFNGNRANLEKHILYSLAEEENFDKYWQYLHHPESFFRKYIRDHIRRYCSEKESEKIKTFLNIILGDIKNTILSAIHKSTAVAKDKGSTASGWLDLFCNFLKCNLIFPRRDLVSIEHQEITDTEFLKEAMSAALDPAMRKVEEDCLSKPMDEIVPDIENILSEHLCGCWKQCPFCHAICTNTIPQHAGDHSVPFHRPQAVSGWHYYETDYFAIDCCTSSVASDQIFMLHDLRKFPYKKYREAGGDFATWSITPDSSTQPYWKWFVCRFRSQLEEKYGKKFTKIGSIPNLWTKITKQEVLDDLKKL